MDARVAVVAAGEAGINALATVRSLGRRGVPVHVVHGAQSAHVASVSRYCAGSTRFEPPESLPQALLRLAGRMALPPVLYVDNDDALRQLAPHAGALASRYRLVDPLADAGRLTDKPSQLEVARQCGIAVPRTWRPQTAGELRAIATRKRLIAKPLAAHAPFKALVAGSAAELEARLRGLAAPSDVLVQEFVEGDDAQIYAAFAYCATSVERTFVMSARKLRQSQPGAGVMAVGQAVDCPEVCEMTRRLARALGLRGMLCTEFKLDPTEGKYYFIEWNPRADSCQSIGWKSGFDLAWLAWCDHTDPARLPRESTFHAKGTYWVNLQCDLMHFSKAPRAAFKPRSWRPYLGRTEWALLALDDLRPWRAGMRQLANWLGARCAGRAAAIGAALAALRPRLGRRRPARTPLPRPR